MFRLNPSNHTYLHPSLHPSVDRSIDRFIHSSIHPSWEHTYAYTYISIHAYIQTDRHKHIHTYAHVHTYTHIDTYIHACIHTCQQTNKHTYIPVNYPISGVPQQLRMSLAPWPDLFDHLSDKGVGLGCIPNGPKDPIIRYSGLNSCEGYGLGEYMVLRYLNH